MNKAHLSFALLTTIGIAHSGLVAGQTISNKLLYPAPKHIVAIGAGSKSSVQVPKSNNPINPLSQSLPPIWSETFSGGIPGTWVNTGVSDPDALWVYRGPATTPNTTVGGQGDCSGNAPINSPTKTNGFIIFDSNYLDNNVYCGGGNAGTATAPQVSTLVTNTINLSAYPAVVLKFNYFGRNYNSTPNVSVSGDGGTTWNEVWAWNLAVNTASANPELVTVNISPYAGGSSNVKLKFTWDGNYYEMMLDDISIEIAPNNDLALQTAFYDTFAGEPDSVFLKYYSQIPACQAAEDSINFASLISNFGGLAQPNSKLDVSVMGAVTFTASSAGITINPGQIVSRIASPPLTPATSGTYNVTFTASSDSTDAYTANNTVTSTFIVGDSIYARDTDNPESYYYVTTAKYSQVGNMFEIFTDDTATSISFSLYDDHTLPGMIIQLHLFDVTLDVTTPLGSSDFYNLTATDIGFGTWRTLPLAPTVPLTRGIYYATIEMWTSPDTLDVLAETGAPVYTSIIYDASASQWYTLGNNPLIRLNLKGCTPSCLMTSSAASTPAMCGGSTGTATVTATGGTAPYSYLWNDPAPAQTTSTATGLAAGTYIVTVTDGGGCISVASVTITSSSSGLAISNVTAGDDTCGSGTGTATVTLGGGVSPFTYTWSPSVGTGATVTGLTAGTYNVTVKDAPGCTATNSVTVNMITTNLAIDSITSVDATSCTAADGSASGYISGGQAPFVYLWNNSQTTTTATGLVSAPYGFLVTDKYGCSDSSAVVVGAVGAPQVSATITGTIACNGGNTGSADATVIGGTPPYTYAWSTSPIQTDSTATGLTAGLYIVTVTDAGSCNAYAQVTITEPTALSTINGSTDVTCNGLNDGTAGVVVSGGTGAYTYSWNTTPPQTGPDATGLAAGSYKVVFNDANNCTDSVSFTITEPTVLSVTASATNVLCNGNSTGSVSATSSGGVAPYSYIWIGGQTSGLGAGNYTVTITDANGCTANASTTITEPPALTVVKDAIDSIRIYITVSGGVSPYSYLWSHGSTAEDAFIPGSGTYTVTVTDINGCTTTLSVTGISENNVNVSFTLNPNPAKEMFVLTMKNMKKDTYAFELRNILGQSLFSESVEISGNFTRKFNVSKLNKGVYFLKVKNSQGERTEKVVKF